MALTGAQGQGRAVPLRGLLVLTVGGALIAFLGGLWTAWWTLVSPWFTASSGIIALALATAAYRLFRCARVPSPAVNAAAGLLLAAATLGTAHVTAWRAFAGGLHARVQAGALDGYLADHGVESWRRLGPDRLAREYLGYVFDLGRPGGYLSYLRLRADEGYDVLAGTRSSALRNRHREGFWVWLELGIDTLVVAWGVLIGVVWACWAGLPAWVPLQRRSPGSPTAAAAARTGDWDRVVELLTEGGDPNARDGDLGPTPLHRAAAAERVDVLERLLDAGAWRDTRDREGRTALHWAARGGAAGALDRLLAAGFYPAPQDRSGRTPLHDAAEAGCAVCVERLLAAGASPRTWDFSGRLPRELAARAGHAAAAALLDAAAEKQG